MIRKKSGYTLIELIIVISLFVIILLGGTTLFVQNLRTGGFTEMDLKLNISLRSVLDEMERKIRFGKVTMVDASDREQCLLAGSTGLTGSSVTTEDLNSLSSVYSLVDNKISSVSGQTGEQVFLNSTDVSINTISIKWFCQSAISDKIILEITASTIPLGSGVTISKSVSREIVLLNSAIN